MGRKDRVGSFPSCITLNNLTTSCNQFFSLGGKDFYVIIYHTNKLINLTSMTNYYTMIIKPQKHIYLKQTTVPSYIFGRISGESNILYIIWASSHAYIYVHAIFKHDF